jgi:hypothetical protein
LILNLRLDPKSLVLLAILPAAAGCGTWPQTGIEALAGCWYFEQDAVARELQLPWGVRLMDRPLDGWPALERLDGVKLAATLTRGGDRDHPFGYWRLFPRGDSVHLGHPGGGGFAVDAGVVPNDDGWPELAGAARPTGDVMPAPGDEATRAARSVRLTRARCPEEG